MIYYFSTDLFSSSKVTGPAQIAGVELKTVSRKSLLLEELGSDVSAVVFDLNSSGKDELFELMQEVRELHPNMKLAAHGPHVDVKLLNRAKELSAQVFTNGQFHSATADILTQLQSSN